LGYACRLVMAPSLLKEQCLKYIYIYIYRKFFEREGHLTRLSFKQEKQQ
jgi:hypothetical protein